MSQNNKLGFSLIELIISIAIIALFTSGVSLWMDSYKKSADLDSSSKMIISSLRSSQIKAASGKDSKNWGVSFIEAQNKIVMFNDDGIVKTTTEETYLPQSIKINGESLLGGCNEIIFSRPRGETAQSCNIKIEDKISPDNFRNINISATGLVTQNP